MLFEWDEAKRKKNMAKHGVDFDSIGGFGWNSAIIKYDGRRHYNEDRYIATGYIGDRLYVCVWTIRNEEVVRLISLRKANRREGEIYEEEAEAIDE